MNDLNRFLNLVLRRSAATAAIGAMFIASHAHASHSDPCPVEPTTVVINGYGAPYSAYFCKGMPYGTYQSTDPRAADAQLFDLYKPLGSGPFPVYVWVHGGGYGGYHRGFDLDEDEEISAVEDYLGVLRLVTRGFAVVSIDYRLAPLPGDVNATVNSNPGAHFPEPQRDAKQAVRWIKARGASFDLDETRIAIGGGSAGAQIAAFVGATAPLSVYEPTGAFFPPGLPSLAEVTSEVNLVIAFSGPHDFSLGLPNEYSDSAASHHLACNTDGFLTYAYFNSCTATRLGEASLLDYAASGPPVYLLHSTADGIVQYEHSESYFQALENANHTATFRTLPAGAGHQEPDPAYWVNSCENGCTSGCKTVAQETDELMQAHVGGPPPAASYECGTPLPPTSCQIGRASHQGNTGLLWSALGLCAAGLWRLNARPARAPARPARGETRRIARRRKPASGEARP